MSAGPLQGIVVVEFGRFVTAPYAARVLGDLGASVIKLEGLDGDPFRTFSGDVEQSPHFRALNRNKRSIAVDVRTAEGRELMQRLVASADVFIENSRPGSMTRMGLGYEELSARNPGLVYCSISGSGPDGPYASRPAYDMVGQALSGLAHASLDPDTLQVTGTNTSDSVTGLNAAVSIAAALVGRATHGRGTHIEIDMLSSSLSFLGAEAQIFLDTGRDPEPTTRPANSLSFAMRCADGGLIGLHLSSVPKFWEGLTDVLGRPELREDPRFRSRPDRSRNYQELRAELQSAFLRRSRAEWLEALIAADVPAAPINTIAEVIDDPQVRHLGLVKGLSHPQLGESRTIGAPHRFSAYPEASMQHPPRLGEHTDAIVAGLLDPEEDASTFEHALGRPPEPTP